VREKALQLVRNAGRDEEDRDQEAESDAFQLGLELRIRGVPGNLDQLHQQAGGERAEDRRETEPVGEHTAAERQGKRGPDTQLAAPDFKMVQQPVQAGEPAHPGEGKPDEHQQDQEDRQRDGLILSRLGGGREEERQEHDGHDLGEGGRGHDQLAELGGFLSRVLQQRQQEPSGRRHENDRQQQRLGILPGQPEGEGGQQPERGRNGERQARQPRQRLAKPVDIDLQPGQEQQHAEAEIAQDRHRRVHPHPAEDRRADHDAGDYLEYRAGYRKPWQQAEHDRDQDRDPRDDKNAVKRDGEHALPPVPGPFQGRQG
jgi:hypothetical protein